MVKFTLNCGFRPQFYLFLITLQSNLFLMTIFKQNNCPTSEVLLALFSSAYRIEITFCRIKIFYP